jgi:Resolvase, N terminal domain
VSGQRLGYIRVSSLDQNTQRQLEDIQLGRVFTDKASGKDTKRPQLEELQTFARDGDTVIVHSMDRLARNLVDLRSLVVTVNFVWRCFHSWEWRFLLTPNPRLPRTAQQTVRDMRSGTAIRG